jgi:hypothetical protein
MNPLDILDEKTARCVSTCEKDYEILFLRENNVPDTEAQISANGQQDLANRDAQDGAESPSETETKEVVVPAALEGVTCVNHAEVRAIVKCRVCWSGICGTCDFCYAGKTHYCPKCVISASEEMSPERKKQLTWSYILAAVASLLFFLFLVGSMSVETETELIMLSILFYVVTLAAGVTGGSLGFGARSWRSGNPISVLIAPIWNLLIVGFMLLLALVGTFMP